MISGHKISARHVDYYLDYVRRGGPSRWIGTAAGNLGLAGAVAPEDFAALAAGARPSGGQLLERIAERRTPGWDFTFSVTKSVSICWALGEAELRGEIEAAHDAAVDAAVGFLERQGGRARRGRGGRDGHVSAGLAVAAFTHPASREADPQLHTHCIVLNVAHGIDGRWTSLDSRLAYAHRAAAGAVYRSALRSGLARLGATWTTPDRRNLSELVGVDEDLRSAFSRRRAQIEGVLAGWGATGAAAAHAACLVSRRAKLDVEVSDLAAEWAERAGALGWDAERVGRVLDGADRRHRLSPSEGARIEAELLGPGGLTQEAAAFRRDDVIRAWSQRCPQGVDTETLEGLVDATLARPEVTPLVVADAEGAPLTTDNPHAKGLVRLVRSPTGAGKLVAEIRYSTAEMLSLEAAVLAAAERTYRAATCPAGEVEAVLAGRSLSAEQADMVRRLCGSRWMIEVVVGVPGSGKTFALGVARRAWESAGAVVVGAALAAEAAAQLQAGSGIAAGTLDSLLAGAESGSAPFGPNTIVVCDEAGMVDTRRLARLVGVVSSAGARLVLTGDDRQLPAVEAGGVFAALARRDGVIRLADNARQVNSWERSAISALRAGRVGEAAGAYARAGRVHAGDDPLVLAEEMIEAWWAARTAGEEVAIFAYSREAAGLLNRLARARLSATGALGADELEVGECVGADLARRSYAVGDEIVCLRNRRHLGPARDPSGTGVRNGTRGVITGIHAGTGEVVMADLEGRRVVLPGAYVVAHTDYAYASTLHKGQGRTVGEGLLTATDPARSRRCGRVFVLGAEGLANEAALVAASRATDSTEFFVLIDEESQEPERQLARAWTRSEAKATATDEAAAYAALARLATASPAELTARRRELAEALGAGPTWDPVGDLAAAHRALGLSALEREAALVGTTVDDGEGEEQREAERTRAGLEARINTELAAAQWVEARLVAARRGGPVDLRTAWAEAELVDSALATRRRRHLDAVAEEPPDYVTDLLGRPPVEPGSDARWRQGMTLIEDWRHRRDFAASASPLPLPAALGEIPGDSWEARTYRRVATEVGLVRRDLGLDGPPAEAQESEPLAVEADPAGAFPFQAQPKPQRRRRPARARSR